MKPYHKIQSVFKRDPDTRFKTLLMGEYSLPEFDFLAGNEWVFTEKVDGTNIRVIYSGGTVQFMGRTDRANIPPLLMQSLEATFEPVLPVIKDLFGDREVCLYGEGFGASIQKAGKLYGSSLRFALFDVLVDGWWLERHNVESIAAKLDLLIAPVLGKGSLADMVKQVEQGFNSTWGDFLAEGLVARPSVELTDRSGHRIITKLKHRDFPKVR